MGEGELVRGVSCVKFSSDDLLFVAKGEVHRFEKHSPDTAVWVIFGSVKDAADTLSRYFAISPY